MTTLAPSTKRRRGVSIVESVAGLAAIGFALVLANRAAHAIDRQWRLDGQERLAVETLDLAMEHATALPADGLSQQRLDALSESLSVERLPSGELSAELNEGAGPLNAKRIVWTVSWEPHPRAEPVTRRLTGWVYPTSEEGTP